MEGREGRGGVMKMQGLLGLKGIEVGGKGKWKSYGGGQTDYRTRKGREKGLEEMENRLEER